MPSKRLTYLRKQLEQAEQDVLEAELNQEGDKVVNTFKAKVRSLKQQVTKQEQKEPGE